MATITFFVGGVKRKSVPVYVRLIAGRKNYFVASSGYTVDPNTWSNKTETLKQRIRTSNDNTFIKNLADLRSCLENEVRNHTGEFSKQWLKGIITRHNSGQTNPEDFNTYLSRFVKEMKEGKPLCRKGSKLVAFPKGSHRGWTNFEVLMTLYQTEHKTRLDFGDFDRAFYLDFVEWLNGRNATANYCGAIIKKLKNILQRAADDELHSNMAFRKFRIMTENVDNIYLTRDDLAAIQGVDLSLDPELAAVRDVFLTGCYTGQRFSDYHRIGKDNIRTVNGRKFIELTQQKTGRRVVIPVSMELDAILKRHDYQLPLVREQQLNDGIRAVAQRAKLNDTVITERTEGGLKVTRKQAKYKLISSHTARRTALTLWYLEGINEIDLMKLSGHASSKQLADYIKATPDETALRLSTHKAFTQLRIAK